MKPRMFMIGAVITANVALLAVVGAPIIVGQNETNEDRQAAFLATVTAVAAGQPEEMRLIDERFLSLYNNGTRDFRTLPRAEIALDIVGPLRLEEAAARSDAIVVAKLEDVRFFTGDIAHIPVSIWSLRVTTVIAGTEREGETFEVTIPGGPVEADEPGGQDYFGTVGLNPIPEPGQELLLFLSSDTSLKRYKTKYALVHEFNWYIIQAGVVRPDFLSEWAGLSGMSRDDAILRVSDAAEARE